MTPTDMNLIVKQAMLLEIVNVLDDWKTDVDKDKL